MEIGGEPKLYYCDPPFRFLWRWGFFCKTIKSKMIFYLVFENLVLGQIRYLGLCPQAILWINGVLECWSIDGEGLPMLNYFAKENRVVIFVFM